MRARFAWCVVFVLGGCAEAPHADDPDASTIVADASVRDSATATQTCTSIGTWNANGLTGEFVPSMNGVANAYWVKFGNPAVNVLGMQAFGVPTSLTGRNVDLSSTVENNYRTCEHCVLVYMDCTFTATGSTCARGPYFQRQGTARFDQVAAASGGSFAGSFTNVELERVTIDRTTFTSTPVAGGDCLTLGGTAFTGTVSTTTMMSGAAGGSESSASATAAGAAPYTNCTSAADCSADTGKCLSVTGKTGSICSESCTSDTLCAIDGGKCVKFGTVGNCLKTCTGTCPSGQTCKTFTTMAGPTAMVCAPSTW